MRRSIVLLVPALLLLVGTSLAVTAAQPAPGDGQSRIVTNYANASSYLTIPDEDVRGTDSVTVGLDAGLAVGIDGRDLQTTHMMASFRHRFDAASTDAERADAYDAIIASVEERADVLRERDAAMNRAHANGTLSADGFLRERAVIVAEASQLQGTISELRAVESETLGFELSGEQQSRLRVVTLQLSYIQGPVAERVAGLATDDGTTHSVYVERSASGHTISLVDGTTYVREAYLDSERDPTADDQFATGDGDRLENARQRALDLYPDTISASVEPFGSTYLYNGIKDSGRLTVFLDAGTTNAFRETQRVNATSLPVDDRLSTTNENIVLRVNTTFATGPMAVTLVDNETGTPVDAPITLDGEMFARTGADGRLWTIEPRDGAQVRAITAEGNLTVAVPGA